MTQFQNLKIGIIGCGLIAKDHLGAIKDYCEKPEIFLCDNNIAAANQFKSQYAIADIFDDAVKMVESTSLDSVHILTPPSSHRSLAELCINSGCNVFLEKPAALSVKETGEIYDLAVSNAKHVCPGHSLLFMECVRKPLEKIKNRLLGDVISVHCFFGHSEKKKTISYGGVSHWAYRMPGGPLLNLVSHPASVVIELLGQADSVNVVSKSRNMMPYGLKDLTHITTQHGDKCGSIVISMAHGNSSRYIDIECERGSLHIDLARQLVLSRSAQGKLGFISKALSGINVGSAYICGTLKVICKVASGRMKSNPGTRYLVREFYKSLAQESTMPVSRDNAIGVAHIIEELIKSQGEIS